MSISIHYQGQLKNISYTDELIAEVSDICQSMSWPYDVIRRGTESCLASLYPNEPNPVNGKVDIKLNGILFTPPHSETIILVFSDSGRIISPIALHFFGNKEDAHFHEFAYFQVVKTQFAGPELHIALIKLFKYLSHKYFSRFEVNDESGYWDDGDADKLNQKFEQMEEMLQQTEMALDTNWTGVEKSLDEIVKQLEKLLEERRNRNNPEDS